MQTPKIIGAGVCALFAIGSLFNALGSLTPGARASGGGSLAVSAVVFVVFAVLAAFLWRSATGRSGPRV
jgi:membrane protein implicated in regulation of membrane protease activity